MELPSALKPHEYSSILEISFSCCRDCTSLPPVDQLPLLKKLTIRNMNQLKVIGVEFLGNRSQGELPFPSLECLIIKELPNWVEWHGFGHETDCVIKLARLSELRLQCCPKLIELPILSLPSLSTLSVKICGEVVLNHMRNLVCLKRLELRCIFGLICLPESFVQFLNAIEYIQDGGCMELETVWISNDIAHNLVKLRDMYIDRCPKLLSFQGVDLLRNLEICRCEALEFLPSSMACLQKLTIIGCPGLKVLPTLDDCITSLEFFFISSRSILNSTNFLGSVHSYSNMTELYIWTCDGLETFPEGGLPTPNLRFLDICDCPDMKSLPYKMDLLLSLEWLKVAICPSLIEPFPQGKTPPNLIGLDIIVCGKFKSLGAWQLQKFTSLHIFKFTSNYSSSNSNEELEVEYDNQHYLLPPSLTTLHLGSPDVETLPKGFLNLPSLRYLQIDNCKKIRELPLELGRPAA